MSQLLSESQQLSKITDRKALVHQCVIWLKEGKSDAVIKATVAVAKPNYTNSWLNELMFDVRKEALVDINRDRTYNIALHFQRYSKEIYDTLQEEYTGNQQQRIMQENYNLMYLIDMAQSKEALMGMHNKKVHLKINNRLTKQNASKYSVTNEQLNKLPLEKQIRALYLLTKSTIKDTDDVVSVQKQTYIQQVNDSAEEITEFVETVQLVPTYENDEPEVIDTGVVVIDEVPSHLRENSISIDAVIGKFRETELNLAKKLTTERRNATRIQNKNDKLFGS